MMRTWIALTIIALAGCDMYFGGDDEPPCPQYGATAPAYEVFDPSSGTCIYEGGWEGCDSSCGPCAENGTAAVDGGGAIYANMAACYSECTGLTEQGCLATAGCYAEYDQGDTNGFTACWQVAPGGGIGSACSGLDPYSCSLHDNCAIRYDVSSGSKKFDACIDEPQAPTSCVSDGDCGSGAHCDTTTCQPCPDCPTCGACADVCIGVCVSDTPTCASTDCGPGYHCEDECYPTDGTTGPTMGYCTATCIPDDSSCAGVDCGAGYQCVETCDGNGGALWCGAQCVPTGSGDPGACTGSVACDALPPSCPSGTTAGILNGCWSGYCIPNYACGPNDPGQCWGDITCTDKGPPLCPSGTTAGIANGCYTDYCIPNGQCTAAPCETLTTESACSGRMDCSPVYTGTNCTCDASGCTCSSLAFARCESWWL